MRLKLLAVFVLWVSLLSAKDGVPFIHSFGELRVYYKDWLVVCKDRGEGECRMVNYLNSNNQPTGFFAQSRLSLTPSQGTNKIELDFYQQNAPSSIESITIELDAKRFDFNATDYTTPNEHNMLETYIINNPTKLFPIIEGSRDARWLTFTYRYATHQEKSVKFSLLGFSKALEFIYKQKAHNFQ
jgi:hypothetical protein